MASSLWRRRERPNPDDQSRPGVSRGHPKPTAYPRPPPPLPPRHRHSTPTPHRCSPPETRTLTMEREVHREDHTGDCSHQTKALPLSPAALGGSQPKHRWGTQPLHTVFNARSNPLGDGKSPPKGDVPQGVRPVPVSNRPVTRGAPEALPLCYVSHIRCGGFGMTPWCDDLVCSWRRLLADRHSLPFPWTLSLHRRWCPSASHHPLTFLFLLALTFPLPSPFPSLGLSLCRPQCPSDVGGEHPPNFSAVQPAECQAAPASAKGQRQHL